MVLHVLPDGPDYGDGASGNGAERRPSGSRLVVLNHKHASDVDRDDLLQSASPLQQIKLPSN
jgi:hypothetical protein